MNRTTSLAAAALGLAAVLAPIAPAGAAPSTRVVTFNVDACEGCEIQLFQTTDPRHPWASKAKTVVGGRVSWTLPVARSTGLNASIRAPWEGHTGYRGQVVFRYAGEQVGDEVSVREARTKKRGALCLAGDDDRRVTEVDLTVRKVRVDGARKRVFGTLAFASETPQWTAPMYTVYDGVGGAQDVVVCG